MTSDWTLALEQNIDLTAAVGSEDAVADALRRGADLRLYMTTDTYEETLYFQQTYAGDGEAFAGLMSHHHSYTHRGAEAAQPYVSFFKYDTSGKFSHIKWMPDNSIWNDGNAYPYGVYRWFVNDRWRVAYEHDEDGNPLQGDLDALKEAVRDGLSIKVGVRQLFGLADDEPSGPDHISFLSIMQPLVQDGDVGANCDFVLVGAPQWPFEWTDGLHLGVLWPWTSGEIVSHLVEPGNMPFRRSLKRRAMHWLVAERG